LTTSESIRAAIVSPYPGLWSWALGGTDLLLLL
jgi:hypothetical protein